MNFTTQHKKTVDNLLPLGIGSGVALYLYSKGKELKEIIWLSIFVFIVSWLLIRSVTKWLVTQSERPEHINVDPDAAGTIDEGFDPKPYTDRLYRDIYSLFSFRDASIYADLASLNNANLRMVYNDWTDRYFAEDNETMIEAMEGENYGNWSSYTYDSANILQRLKGMGAH